MSQNSMFTRRFETFRQNLADMKLQGALIGSKAHMQYLLGFTTESATYFFVPAADCAVTPTIFNSPLEAEIVKAKLPFPQFDQYIYNQTLPPKVRSALSSRNYKTITYKNQETVIPNHVLQHFLTTEYQDQLKKEITLTKEGFSNIQLTFPEIFEIGIMNNKLMLSEWENLPLLVPRMRDFTVFAEFLHDAHIVQIGLEYQDLNYQNYLNLTETYKNYGHGEPHLTNIWPTLENQRIIKDAHEIELLKKAAEIGDIGFTAADKAIQELATEHEVQAEAEYAMKKAGSKEPSFETIVVSGPNSAFPHGHASNRKIENGDLVTVDLGAVYEGYHSDMTRTVIARNIGSAESRKILQIVNHAHKIAIASLKVGQDWREPDRIVHTYFQEQNVDQYYVHSLGHGVGVQTHESPWISSTFPSINELQTGMVFTIEPGIYIPGKGGARTEDTIFLTDHGSILLNHSPYLLYEN